MCNAPFFYWCPGFENGRVALLMKRAIVGFHQDEQGDWVARLACGHNQHVRHNPPWQNREWVTQQETRQQHLGTVLNCKKCEEHVPRDWS